MGFMSWLSGTDPRELDDEQSPEDEWTVIDPYPRADFWRFRWIIGPGSKAGRVFLVQILAVILVAALAAAGAWALFR